MPFRRQSMGGQSENTVHMNSGFSFDAAADVNKSHRTYSS